MVIPCGIRKEQRLGAILKVGSEEWDNTVGKASPETITWGNLEEDEPDPDIMYHIPAYKAYKDNNCMRPGKVTVDQTLNDYQAIFPHHAIQETKPPNRDDHRNLLNVPLEIRFNILRFLLQTPTDIKVMLNMSCEHHSFCKVHKPNYSIHPKGAYSEHHVVHGVYHVTESHEGAEPIYNISQVEIKHLDATVLRVCSQLHNEGSSLLYGGNHFVFDTGVLAIEEYSNDHIDDWPVMNSHCDFYTSKKFVEYRRCFDNILKASKIENAGKWMKCFPFTSFLTKIGPWKAAMINSVTIVGDIRFMEEQRQNMVLAASRMDVRYQFPLTLASAYLMCSNLARMDIDVWAYDVHLNPRLLRRQARDIISEMMAMTSDVFYERSFIMGASISGTGQDFTCDLKIISQNTKEEAEQQRQDKLEMATKRLRINN